jgi:transposase, IS5 family
MKNLNPLGLFDDHFVSEKLSKLGNPLQKLDQYIDWKIFEEAINESFEKEVKDRKKGGRPAYNKLMLFKALIIQSLYNLSDEQLEYQILDRSSFKQFLGLKKSDRVPDSRTFWHFREQLIAFGSIESLFRNFNSQLDKSGVFANEGKMVDASFVEVPKQRNTREENKEIKEGKVPESWQENSHKLAQKDTDARWTKKNNVSFYGYKNHIKADTKTKLIKEYAVTNASVHDSQVIGELLDEADKGEAFYADSAYTGQAAEKIYQEKGVVNCVNEKGYKNKPLTEEQKTTNREKSKVRARVEHIFGFVENSMNGSYIRTIGMARAKAKIGMMNIVYNICRCVQLKKVVSMG